MSHACYWLEIGHFWAMAYGDNAMLFPSTWKTWGMSGQKGHDLLNLIFCHYCMEIIHVTSNPFRCMQTKGYFD